MAGLNVLYIHSHDTGRLIEPYGYPFAAPNLQRFAEDGVLFRQAFSAAPTCSPSRAALLTGRHPHCCGMHGLVNAGHSLKDPSRHLANFLRRSGYRTALAGIQHVAMPPWSDPQALGYDEFLDHNGDGKPGDFARIADVAAAYLNRSHHRPFFLSVGFVETHRRSVVADPTLKQRAFTYDPDADPLSVDTRYVRSPAWLPDTPVMREDAANFADGVRRLDQKVGALLRALERTGLRETTLVIITTDHGVAMPHAKCNLTDLGVGVMLMMRGPRDGIWSGGKVIDAMVTHLDVFPTICDEAGVEKPGWLQGRSLLPLVRGDVQRLHDVIFAEQGYHGHRDAQRAVRNERYKYIRRLDCASIRVPDTEAPSTRWFSRLGYAARPAGRELLYDLWFDPLEQHNLSADSGHAAVLVEMREHLDRWMENTDDPFRHGDLPPQPADLEQI